LSQVIKSLHALSIVYWSNSLQYLKSTKLVTKSLYTTSMVARTFTAARFVMSILFLFHFFQFSHWLFITNIEFLLYFIQFPPWFVFLPYLYLCFNKYIENYWSSRVIHNESLEWFFVSNYCHAQIVEGARCMIESIIPLAIFVVKSLYGFVHFLSEFMFIYSIMISLTKFGHLLTHMAFSI
jgi:hypothetical protein